MDMENWSDDDLDWLCGFGGASLLKWETLGRGYHRRDPATVMMVDHWMWLSSFYISMSYAGWDLSCPEVFEMLQMHVQSLRMKSDYCRLHGFPYLKPP